MQQEFAEPKLKPGPFGSRIHALTQYTVLFPQYATITSSQTNRSEIIRNFQGK